MTLATVLNSFRLWEPKQRGKMYVARAPKLNLKLNILYSIHPIISLNFLFGILKKKVWRDRRKTRRKNEIINECQSTSHFRPLFEQKTGCSSPFFFCLFLSYFPSIIKQRLLHNTLLSSSTVSSRKSRERVRTQHIKRDPQTKRKTSTVGLSNPLIHRGAFLHGRASFQFVFSPFLFLFFLVLFLPIIR